MVVQKMQGSRASYIGCPKNDIRAGCPTSSKNCSLNRDVECPSVGTIFAHIFSERSAMAAHLQLPRKKAPNPTDQHVGARVRILVVMADRNLAQPSLSPIYHSQLLLLY